MKKIFTLNIAFLLLISTLLFSCTKMPGHSLIPVVATTTNSGGSSTGGGTSGGNSGTDTIGTGVGNTGWGGSGITPKSGTGAIAVGPLNSVIFRINNDTTYTWPSKFFNTQIITVSPPFPYTQIDLSAKSSTGVNSCHLKYSSLTVGTFNIGITISVCLYVGNTFVQKYYYSSHCTTKVLTEDLSTQTATGTFEGYVNEFSTSDSLKITGSFNLKQ